MTSELEFRWPFAGLRDALRGGRPERGLEVMVRRRGRADRVADGPGKLTQALGVTGKHDGTNVVDGPVRIGEVVEMFDHVTTARIGISKAIERPWRFVRA